MINTCQNDIIGESVFIYLNTKILKNLQNSDYSVSKYSYRYQAIIITKIWKNIRMSILF